MIFGVLNPNLNLQFMNLQFTIGRLDFGSLNRIIIFFMILIIPFGLNAQSDTIRYEVGVLGVASTGAYSPFWLQSNQYGQIAASPTSANINIGINKEFGKKTHLIDYGFKANVLLQTYDKKTNIYFHEFYAKARFSVFDLVIGAREDHYGNQDSTLSCGGFLFSRNARPMPKVTVGIEHFTPVPFTNGYLEIKGAISHGWFADNIYTSNLLLHHKYLYARIGGRLPVHFQYGLDHVAQWGGVVPGLGQQPNGLADLVRIFLGKSGGKNALETDQINVLGNHIISQSMKLEADISHFKISGYWQNLSEDGPVRVIWNTMNISDGLLGISIKSSKCTFINKILYEYLNTTDQSGPYHDKDGLIYGGSDDYLNNGVYQNGWTYFSRTIGTPLITSPVYNQDGAVSILNNRVQVHHVGIEGNISGYEYRYLMSISKNYGTYRSPYTEMKPNTSILLEVKKDFPKLYNIQCVVSMGVDIGKIYGNSIGCMFSVRKFGDLFHY
jgi:hypothetical protein